MTARTHDMFAVASLVTVAAYYPPETLTIATVLVSLIANNIGALIPDMDSATNRLWDLMPAGDFIGKFFRRIFWKHRTLSHSIIGVVAIFFALDWVFYKIFSPEYLDINIVLISTMIGYLSHLFSDSLTKEGLPLLFPINLNFGLPPIKALRITTGKWFEKAIVFPGLILYLFWFAFSHQDRLLSLIKTIG